MTPTTDEMFAVFLPEELLQRLRNGEPGSIEEAKDMLHGVEIYDHVFSDQSRKWEQVTLAELETRSIINGFILIADGRYMRVETQKC